MTIHDKLGDDCKRLESLSETRLLPNVPFVARLDGRAFHTFTRGLKRPFDDGFHDLMLRTTIAIVKEFHAQVGYTQSDEITLAFQAQDQPLFDGRVQKLTSVLASYAGAVFNQGLLNHSPNRSTDRAHAVLLRSKASFIPCFDCRVWALPTLQDVVDVFIWREDDAVRNSISAVAQSLYSAKSLFEKNQKEQLDMCHEKGINWGSHYQDHFKRGQYVRRRSVTRMMTEAELANIPEQHRPTGPVTRHTVEPESCPPLRSIQNAAGFLMAGEAPAVYPPGEHYPRRSERATP